MMEGAAATLVQRLESELGEIDWPGLERHFARGALVWIDPSQDLVSVAVSVVEDDAVRIGTMMDQGSIRRVTAADAVTWQREQRTFRALVAAPWVLVQPLGRPDPENTDS